MPKRTELPPIQMPIRPDSSMLYDIVYDDGPDSLPKDDWYVDVLRRAIGKVTVEGLGHRIESQLEGISVRQGKWQPDQGVFNPNIKSRSVFWGIEIPDSDNETYARGLTCDLGFEKTDSNGQMHLFVTHPSAVAVLKWYRSRVTPETLQAIRDFFATNDDNPESWEKENTHLRLER